MVDDNLYKQTFDTAIQELSDLMEERENLDNQREEITARIAKVRRGVLALSPLVGEEPKSVETKYPHLFPELIPPDIGLTDAVRKVLQVNNIFLTPVKVKTELKVVGYDIDRYKNILASIHTILKRLLDAGEVESGSVNEVTAYKWKQVKPGNSADPKPIINVPTVKRPVLSKPKTGFPLTVEDAFKIMNERNKK
jgi:hypothetical protein